MEERENKGNRNFGNKIQILLHVLKHVLFVTAVVLLVNVIFGIFMTVQTRAGEQVFRVNITEADEKFEDSAAFKQLFENSIRDIICYGAIRTQMETKAKYDPMKIVDVTAFANRYEGLKEEYISANYYLEDLLKWAKNGFDYQEVSLDEKELDKFLSRKRMITKVNLPESHFSGNTMSYLNSDVKKENIAEEAFPGEEEVIREAVTIPVLTNRYLTEDGMKIEDRVSSVDEYTALCNAVEKAAKDLQINFDEYQVYNEYYDSLNSNIVYYIIRTVGDEKTIYSNMTIKDTDFKKLAKEVQQQCVRYLIYNQENMLFETNTEVEEESVRFVLNGYSYAYPEDTQVIVGVKYNYPVADAFGEAKGMFEESAPSLWKVLICALIFSVLYLVVMMLLSIREGIAGTGIDGKPVFTDNRADEIPTELFIGISVLLVVGVLLIFDKIFPLSGVEKEFLIQKKLLPVCAGIIAFGVSLLISFIYFGLIRRIRKNTLWKKSLINSLLGLCKKGVVYFCNNASAIVRACAPFVAVVLVHLTAFILMLSYDHVFMVVLTILAILLFDGYVAYLLCKSASDRNEIIQGIQKINEGDMGHKIDTEGLLGDNLLLAESVNSIGNGMKQAVEKSMKDERMKADLITNVSHDIKTPLTSIINYVDLIKRENVENPKVKEYIDVLDVKSQRLKQLTDDLVEASKISSGNIILHKEKINLVELLNQTIGEFSDKFEQKNLIPMFRFDKNTMFIEADSRRIWRVIENLFNNIFKYALEGTRVYIDLKERTQEGQILLSILNISANPISVNTDELTERFIRGDESRTTEGSGLGLSIAKNLTEVQNGKFEIVVDGDLFKVNLIFPVYENTEA